MFKQSEQFLVTLCFFKLVPGAFLYLRILKQLELKFENIIGIEKHAGKVRQLAVWLLQNCENVERNLLFFAIKSDKVDSLISIFASCK